MEALAGIVLIVISVAMIAFIIRTVQSNMAG